MITGHNIVYFGDEWGGLMRNRQQLMSIFARQNKVLFVEKRPPSFGTMLDQAGRGELALSGLRRASVRKISDNLFVFHYPDWAPVSERPILKSLTSTIRRLYFRDALRKLRMSQPIVWFYHPEWVDLVDEVPSACLRLYHVVDEYTSYQCVTPDRRRRIEAREKRMMAHVDAVVVVSEKLYEAKRPFHPNTHLVPNGVNYQAYTDALADPCLPEELQVIRRPRVGYSGLIGDKLELDVLARLAQGNPQWSFVFLGHVNAAKKAETWQRLQAMPNVHYLGSVGWSQVPHYVKGFDVGLMPYVQDRHSETNSPLKLYDYLAAGLPVASMSIPAAQRFASCVHLADGPEDFARAVQAALADTSPESRLARRRVAAQHTWEARVEQLSDLIRDQLTARKELA